MVTHAAQRLRDRLAVLVEAVAAGTVLPGTVLPGVDRCLLRVEGDAVGGAWAAAAGPADLHADDSFHQAYRELIFEPAGMSGTWPEGPERREVPISRHHLDGVDIIAMDPSVDWGGGGLVSTAADLARLLGALRGGRVVSQRG